MGGGGGGGGGYNFGCIEKNILAVLDPDPVQNLTLRIKKNFKKLKPSSLKSIIIVPICFIFYSFFHMIHFQFSIINLINQWVKTVLL